MKKALQKHILQIHFDKYWFHELIFADALFTLNFAAYVYI